MSVLAVARTSAHQVILDAFTRLPFVSGVVGKTRSTAIVTTRRGELTLHVTAPDDAGTALVWHTGSRRHIELLQERATLHGLRFDAARLAAGSGERIKSATEEEFYARLGLPPVPPELREGDDEVEAAERSALPDLVTERHVRGDLHVHTTWSDGRDTVEYMVIAARQLGYEYVAITDHSERSWASRKLSVDDIPRQRREIEELRARYGGVEILHGVEVDIMHDGTLDFDDELLAGFDIVIASLHDHGGQDGAALTARYLRAMGNPLVNIIAHPANRSPALSSGYDVDFDELFSAAAETGTALEIDGAPGHLDMDGAVARRAVAAGVTVTIDSDCHRAEALGRQMEFGLGTARRGWVEARHVLNARPIADVRAFVARKRRGL